ncbi:MAG: hypothetical protein SGBAC_008027 [Bacillariaceae sp.]
MSVKSKGTATTSSLTATSTSSSDDVLYCDSDEDEDAKAKSKSSRSIASKPGVERVKRGASKRYTKDRSINSGTTNSNSQSIHILYGDEDDDVKAKAKASRRSSKGSRPGIERSDKSSHHKSRRSKMDLLYGDDGGDSKAKAKASRRKANSSSAIPGIEEVIDADQSQGGGKRELLYGGKDSKAKAKRSTRRLIPGVEQLTDSEISDESQERDATTCMAFAGDAPEAAVEGETVQENKGRGRRNKLWIIIGVLGCLFLLVTGGVAAFILLRSSGASANLGNATAPSVGNNDGGQSPSILPPTAASGTNAPTNGPTTLQIYDPPSLEDCQAIANNQTIAGQENLTRSDFNIQLDVKLSVHSEQVSDEMVQELLDALQQIFLPALAGCDEDASRRNLTQTNSLPSMRGSSPNKRQLLNGASQYVISNAFIGDSDETEIACEEAADDQTGCYRITVEVSLYLKGPTQFFDIASLISEQAQSESNLVISFDLPYPFSEVKLTGVDNSIETPMPTDVPNGVTEAGGIGPACDGSEAIVDIGCGSCTGVSSCIALRENIDAPGTISPIGDKSCQQLGACDFAMVVAIADSSCVGQYSCQGRNIEAGSGSCRALYACAAHMFNPTGKLVVGQESCNGQYSCYSHGITVESTSCGLDWSCAGRTKMYVGNAACTAKNACSGTVFTNGSIYQAQTQTSYFGQGSCICENCCVCMIRVISGRCTTPGECCDVNSPTDKVAGVVDNTDAELKLDFGVSDLSELFLGGY